MVVYLSLFCLVSFGLFELGCRVSSLGESRLCVFGWIMTLLQRECCQNVLEWLDDSPCDAAFGQVDFVESRRAGNVLDASSAFHSNETHVFHGLCNQEYQQDKSLLD